MLTSPIFKQRVTVRKTGSDFSEINRLLAAAVVSSKFCALLLSDPDRAIAQGYAGEQFFLSDEEYALVLSIRGSSLQEFAQRLSEVIPPQPVLTMPPVYTDRIDAHMTAL